MANLQQYEAGVTALEKELAQCKATLQVLTLLALLVQNYAC
jgi:hypothetical protein